jgi:hypothetical protein
VRFSRLEPLAVATKLFPAAQFIKIDPGKTEDGTYTSYGPSKGCLPIDRTEVAWLNFDYRREWDIRFLIAYGYEIESFKQGSKSNEHPINPIVRWQRIAYSNPERFVFE